MMERLGSTWEKPVDVVGMNGWFVHENYTLMIKVDCWYQSHFLLVVVIPVTFGCLGCYQT